MRATASWAEWRLTAVGGVTGGLGFLLGIGLMVVGADISGWGLLLVPLGLAVLVVSQAAAFRLYRARRRLRPPD